MQNFKKILNNIVKNDIKFQKALAESPSPCCAAFNKLSKPTNLISRIRGMLDNVRGSQNAARLFSNDLKKFTIDELLYFTEKYCECTKPPASSYPFLPQPDTGTAIVESYGRPLYNQIDVISIMHPTNVQEKACAIAIEEVLKDKRFDSADLFNNFLPNDASLQKDIRYFSNDLKEVLMWIMLDMNLSYLFDKSSLLDFIKSLCRLKRNTPHLYESYIRDLRIRINSPTIGLWFESTPSVFENILSSSENSDTVTPDCPPSPNDPSIISLATAVGATAIAAGTVVWLFLRKRAKKCTSVVTAARGLTGAIMTQFEGSSASSEQLDQEEINRIAQEIIEKECTGVLPRSCQEGGFEGGGSQPPGGETEPPSGGGGGMTGGDGVL